MTDKPSVLRVAAPCNSLPDWDECALRVANSDFIEKRVAEGGYGADPDSKLASELHRFICEYDDADTYSSGWFLHRLELVLKECRAEAYAAGAEDMRERAANEAGRMKMYPGGRCEAPAHDNVWAAEKAIRALPITPATGEQA